MKTPTLIFAISILASGLNLRAQTDESIGLDPAFYEVNDYVNENEKCLRCHGELKYTIEDKATGKVLTEQMCECNIIDRTAYYTGVHKAFACGDCHSYGFEEFPHSIEARMEEMLLCMDCHGYDESFAQYHFEDIEIEFSESTHNMTDFTCWKCHNPHSYRAFMRNADDIGEAVLYDNDICLSCHSDFDRFMLLTDRKEINIVESHDWLPNQVAHFRSVRCIECHTEISDSILIAHKILPKTEAVQNCTECHSQDSRLMHTLYKFQIKEERKVGFANGIIINNAYVIGANQNVFLNVISLLVFGLTFLVILIHAVLRYIKLKNK
ncbi:MAG: cytochrome c3 family protein [Bacteroidota bacterium]